LDGSRAGGISGERLAGCALLGFGGFVLVLIPLQAWLERRRYSLVAS
jgi:hypothetical protein